MTMRPLLIVLATVGVPSAWPGEVTAQLQPRIQVRSTPVLLSDLAKVSGPDETLNEKVRKLSFAKVPRLDGPISFSRREIERRIRQSVPAADAQVSLQGADEVHVELKTQLLDRSELEAVARQQLDTLLQAHAQGAYSAIVDDDQQRYELPMGIVRLTAQPAFRSQLAKRIAIWVDIYVDQRHVKTIPVPFRISVPGPVYRLKRAVSAGDIVTQKDVAVAQVDLAALPSAAWSANKTSSGWKATRSLPVSAIVLRNDLVARSAVSRGDVVRIILNSPGVVIERAGQALQDGEPGQVIDIVPEGASQRMKARVARSGVVIVEGG